MQSYINSTGNDALKVGGGRPTVLTSDEEKEIVTTCQILQELGFGVTRDIVTKVIAEYLAASS